MRDQFKLKIFQKKCYLIGYIFVLDDFPKYFVEFAQKPIKNWCLAYSFILVNLTVQGGQKVRYCLSTLSKA